MTISIPALSANTPFLQGVPNSLITREWYRLLVSLTDAVGGAGTSPTSLPSVELSQVMDVDTPAFESALSQSVSSIESQLAMAIEPTAELAQLRAMLGCGKAWAPGTVDGALAEAYAPLVEQWKQQGMCK